MTYRPPEPTTAYPTPLAQPQTGQAALIPPPPPVMASIPVVPKAGRRASPWIIGVLALVLVALIGYFLSAIGPGASLIGLVVALIPITVVLLGVRMIDRWEPEPRGLLVFAVAWGAIAAVGFALLVDLGMYFVLGPDDSLARELFAGIVQAPLAEELGKGIGVFLIFATARRAFDGPVDGIVYGALIGAGFAFTENIQYFAISYIEGGAGSLSATFFARGILSPFTHAMFTAVTGFALGLAARRGASAGAALGPWILGMLGAAALHALWNGSAMLGDFLVLYVVIQVPLFIGFILWIVALRREESRLTYARLGDYAAAGWFTPQEVSMLATPAGRRQGLAWARSLAGDRSTIMKTFISDATSLAAARQRAVSGRDLRAAEDEHVLLARTAAARTQLLSY